MVSLTATAQPGTASVLLEVDAATDGPVVITRTDANGTNPVRLRVGQEPIAGSLTVIDYEPALNGALSYDVVDASSASASATLDPGLGITVPQLTAVQLPQLSAAPQLVTGYTAGRQSASAVLRVVNRADPVVLFGPTRTREGRLDTWCADHETALDVAEVLTKAKVVLFRQGDHPGLDMYFVASHVETQPLQRVIDGWRWQTSCDYVEVRNPSLPLLGAAGWTFGDLATEYATFGAVRAAFDDFGAVLVGA